MSSSPQIRDCRAQGGTFVNQGFNVLGAGCPITTTDVAIDLRLGAEMQADDLAWVPLLPGSPAIDAGSCLDLDQQGVTSDIRGTERPLGGRCDAGA